MALCGTLLLNELRRATRRRFSSFCVGALFESMGCGSLVNRYNRNGEVTVLFMESCYLDLRVIKDLFFSTVPVFVLYFMHAGMTLKWSFARIPIIPNFPIASDALARASQDWLRWLFCVLPGSLFIPFRTLRCRPTRPTSTRHWLSKVSDKRTRIAVLLWVYAVRRLL